VAFLNPVGGLKGKLCERGYFFEFWDLAHSNCARNVYLRGLRVKKLLQSDGLPFERQNATVWFVNLQNVESVTCGALVPSKHVC
jgi:hypothetical protein